MEQDKVERERVKVKSTYIIQCEETEGLHIHVQVCIAATNWEGV